MRDENKKMLNPSDPIPAEFIMKNRWAVTSGNAENEHDKPNGKIYMDFETGWGVRNDDPRTLHSFNEAIRAVEESRGYTVVYIADEDDDLELVDKLNRTLCPIHDLPQDGLPTYWQLHAGEPMLKNSDQVEPFDLPDLIPHLAYLIFEHYPENKGVEMHAQELASLLNLDAQIRGDETTYIQ